VEHLPSTSRLEKKKAPKNKKEVKNKRRALCFGISPLYNRGSKKKRLLNTKEEVENEKELSLF
jgi:hypothetical protein